MREYQREYRKTHPLTDGQRERHNAYQRKKYAENAIVRETAKARMKKWNETHPKEYAARMLAYYKRCAAYWAEVVAAFSADTKDA